MFMFIMHDQWRESQMKININDNYYYMCYDDDVDVDACMCLWSEPVKWLVWFRLT